MANTVKNSRKNPIVTIEKKAIALGNRTIGTAKKNYFYAGAAASATLLATMVGLGVYLMRRKTAKTSDFQNMKIRILREIENTGEKISEKLKHWRHDK